MTSLVTPTLTTDNDNHNEHHGFDAVDLSSSEQAFNLLSPEIHAISDSEVFAINVDVAVAAMIGLRAAPRIEVLVQAYLEQKRLPPDFDVRNANRLRLYAAAAWHAHVMATPATDGRLQFLIAEATKLKKSLLVWADALADRGFFSAERIAEIRAGSGYVDLANDVVALGQMYSDEWCTIEDKCAVTREEVDRAKVLGLEILVELGAKREGGDEQSLRTKAKAFTLFARAYDQCRRLVSYMRWDAEDVDAIVPSLYMRKRRRNADQEQETPALAPTVVTPVPTTAPPTPEPEGPGVPQLPMTD